MDWRGCTGMMFQFWRNMLQCLTHFLRSTILLLLHILYVHNAISADMEINLICLQNSQGFIPNMYVTGKKTCLLLLTLQLITISSEWFTTLFVYRLPLHTILRVWDFFFTYGQAALFKVGLALLSNCEGMCYSSMMWYSFLIPSDLIGLAMEPLVDQLKIKLANITPQEIIPRAYAIQIPKEYVTKLVDDGLRKKRKTKLKLKLDSDNNSCKIM
jgi:hypothetical protein